MKFFVDANVFLEILLVQEKATAAQQFLASFDGDFDRTPRGRRTPEVILEG